jgi:hypothetical protein
VSKSGRIKTGGQTTSVEVSPARRRRLAQRRRREEARWAAKAGPVTVRRIDVPAAVPGEEGRPE